VLGRKLPWGEHARRKYGKYRVCDERFYLYWVPGPIELIFPDWFCSLAQGKSSGNAFGYQKAGLLDGDAGD